jgi:UDP-N-acetyl-D-mannosaminuronate dehydrogenase
MRHITDYAGMESHTENIFRLYGIAYNRGGRVLNKKYSRRERNVIELRNTHPFFGRVGSINR